MITMYLCFLAGGAVLPFLSVLFGSLGDGVDADIDVDIDVDVDVDVNVETDFDTSFSIGLLPTSLMSLSALAITFGAVGGIMSYLERGKIITFVSAIIAGYVASIIVQTIIKTLKKVQRENEGIDENELMLYEGRVIDSILPGKLGTVSFTTLKNIQVSYPARCSDESLKLETGRVVKVKEIQNSIFVVEPKNKYE